ncbi:MAG: hypothetical protein ACE5JH_02695 [Acidobacteriota bacterium]
MSAGLIVKAMLIAAVLFVLAAIASTTAYRITAAAVEILILGKVVRRIPLPEIEEVHRRGALLHENWSGPKFWNAVTIRRRRGLLRNVVISPDDPDGFVRRLQEAIRRAAPGPLP